jgi:hypothetical protein
MVYCFLCLAIPDWVNERKDYVKMWDERRYRKDRKKGVVNWEAYERHLRWFDDGIKYRVRLRPQWTMAEITSLLY